MRLIDANELIDFFTQDTGGIPMTDIKTSLDDVTEGIAQAETVEAISIDWLTNYAQLMDEIGSEDKFIFIWNMIHDWRIDNEASKKVEL